ncbi:MAG: hypothetical protein AAB906_00680, partial [Patescibacteria group bacterium]
MKKIQFLFAKPYRLLFMGGQGDIPDKQPEAPETKNEELASAEVDAAKQKFDKDLSAFQTVLRKQSEAHNMPELQGLTDIAETYQGTLDQVVGEVTKGNQTYKKALSVLQSLVERHDAATAPVFEAAN